MRAIRAGGSSPARTDWAGVALGIGAVAISTTLGVLIGIGLRIMVGPHYPTLGVRLEVWTAVLGFGLGWCWYAVIWRR